MMIKANQEYNDISHISPRFPRSLLSYEQPCPNCFIFNAAHPSEKNH